MHEPEIREFARLELQQRRRKDVIPLLQAWIAGLDPAEPDYEHHLVEALWVGQGINSIDVDLLQQLLTAKGAKARMAATRVLRFWQDQIDAAIDLLANQIDDPDPRVRLQAVLACGFSHSPRSLATALGAAEYTMDAGLEHALNDTLNYLEQQERSQGDP